MKYRRAKRASRTKSARSKSKEREITMEHGFDPGEKLTRLFVNAMALLVSDPEQFFTELSNSYIEIANDEGAKLMWQMELDRYSRNMKIEQIEFIMDTGDERLLPLIGDLADDEAPEIRQIVAKSIEEFPFEKSIPILSKLIADSNSAVRKHARASLSALKKKGLDISSVFSPPIEEEKPLHACYINRSWRETGIASVIIAREMSPGKLKFACFLVDRWGMGLKDVFGNVDFPADKLHSEVIPMYKLSGQKLIPLDISTARQLIWGAVDFLDQKGYRMPSDFKYWKDLPGMLQEHDRAEPLLASDGHLFFLDDSTELMEEGKSGKPNN